MEFHGISDLGFYGLNDEQEVEELKTALDTLRRLYDGQFFIGDMMCAFSKVLSFYHDSSFTQAMSRNAVQAYELSRMWRLHTLVWAARSAAALPGDFVECGVYIGLSAGVIADTLGFEALDKTFFLYDTFAGLAEDYSDEVERAQSNYEVTEDVLYESVKKRFSQWPNVQVVKGIVPVIFEDVCPDRIAYLHIDLNAAKAEIGAPDVLFDKVVSGGFIILDDYGTKRGHRQHEAENAWMKERGYEILEMPTGQGLIVKR